MRCALAQVVSGAAGAVDRGKQWIFAVRVAINGLHAATAEAHCLVQSMARCATAAIRSQALKKSARAINVPRRTESGHSTGGIRKRAQVTDAYCGDHRC